VELKKKAAGEDGSRGGKNLGSELNSGGILGFPQNVGAEPDGLNRREGGKRGEEKKERWSGVQKKVKNVALFGGEVCIGTVCLPFSGNS